MTDDRYDVIIAGCGPAGAIAAALFGARGVKTLVVEKSRTIYDKPRAIAIDHEILRVLQNVGLGEAIKPYTAPFAPAEYFGLDGQLIKRLTMLPPPYPMGWTPSMVFLQPAVEEVLRQHLATLPTVAVHYGVELTSLQNSDTGVTVDLRGDTGEAGTARGRFLIGCDGASSTVRTLAGMTLDDLDFDQSWLVVDMRVNDRGLAKLPTNGAHHCRPERPTTYVIGTDNHRRWEFKLREGEDRRAMEQSETVWQLLSPWLSPDDATLWRSASYRFHALVAHDWRRQSVFVAGDAAHQQPPFLGQGLCQGVRDVGNLAWKIERVLRGQSADALLDTYTIERAAHVRRLHDVIIGIGRVIGETDEAAARARDMRLVAEAGGLIKSTPRQNFQPAMAEGCLSDTASPHRGTLFPQPAVLAGAKPVLMDDVVGSGLRLILSEHFTGWTAAHAAAATSLGIHVARIAHTASAAAPAVAPESPQMLIEADGIVARWFVVAGAAAALVRPDHYVFGTARDGASLSALLASLAARLGVGRVGSST